MRTPRLAKSEPIDHSGHRAPAAFRQPFSMNFARVTALLCAGVAALSVFGLTACQRALFPSDLPRNQFETHDRMRQAYTPLEEPDVFGTPQPALRARLTQQTGSGT